MKLGLTYKKKEPKGRRRQEFLGKHLIWGIRNMDIVEEEPSGKGSSTDPFRMATIGQWAAAAARKTQHGHDLYDIGGQLIERVPSTGDRGPESYGDYVTAVTGTDIVKPRKPGDRINDGYSNAGRARLFDSPRSGTPIYQTKYERFETEREQGDQLDDKRLAKQTRDILKGQGMTTYAAKELPGTVGALFLAEVARSKHMLPIGLMLLDLIEVGARYGSPDSSGKRYTFKRMMVESSRTGSTTNRFPLGGKHPMVRNGTIDESREMFNAFNSVTARSASIVTAWLGCYLNEHPGWAIKVRTATDHPKIGVNVFKQFDRDSVKAQGGAFGFYRDVIAPALAERSATLDCLLSEGAEFTYAQPVSAEDSD